MPSLSVCLRRPNICRAVRQKIALDSKSKSSNCSNQSFKDVNKTKKYWGRHIWEMSGLPALVLSSFSNFRSQFSFFLQEKPTERGISFAFVKPKLWRFQLGRFSKTSTFPAVFFFPLFFKFLFRSWGHSESRRNIMQLQTVFSFSGHVLTVQYSHEECLLQSWRLNHK